MSPFWALVWRVYDTSLVYGALKPLGGARLAPWLFGKMFGVKGRRHPL